MTDDESPEARRHRWARAMRSMPTVDAAADMLEAYELLLTAEPEVDVDLTDLEVDDVPYELAEIESLPDWSYVTLLAHMIKRRPAPAHRFEGEAVPRVMQAKDLLAGRKYELVGMLALCTEQAWELGDGQALQAMAKLTQAAAIQVIGEAALRVVFGGDDSPGVS